MENRKLLHIYDELISLENLFLCWEQFRRGKRKKKDVLAFERKLEDNIFELHEQLKARTYRHQTYTTFQIWDPKHRIISKSAVRDRLVHHIVFNELYRIFDPQFIYHTYACRLNRGTHLAVTNLKKVLRKSSRNYTRNTFALKCDIHKFFYSVSHKKLFEIMQNKINDSQVLWLIEEIINSFAVDKNLERERERASRLSHWQSYLPDFCQHIFK